MDMNYNTLKKNFESHGFITSYFEKKEEAIQYLTDSIHGKVIGIGGSKTVQELGLDVTLAGDNEVIWHWLEPGQPTLDRAKQAEIYICSANGVSETGELINIDGTGNRVSMTLFGPQKTYYLIGSNKIEPNLQEAVKRAKNVAAPKNAMRLNAKTPCVSNGGDHCYDCSSPARICKATVILERPCGVMEVELVFINEELGY